MNEELIEIFRNMGRKAALSLRENASTMDGTQIIERELDIPDFDPEKDYTKTPAGSPVKDDGQVYTLLQPHNAKNFVGRPSSLRALWSLCHTKDPRRAKGWMVPDGISGLWMKGECYIDTKGAVHRAKQDNLVYDAETLPNSWETVDTSSLV